MVSVNDIPLMRSGNTGGNLFFTVLYIGLAPFWIPLAVLVLVGTDYNGWGQRLTSSALGRLPGVAAAGWRSGIVLFGYAAVVSLVAVTALGAVAGGPAAQAGPGAQPTTIGPTTEGGPPGGTSTTPMPTTTAPTPTPSTTPRPTVTLTTTTTQLTTSTDTPTPTQTSTNTPTTTRTTTTTTGAQTEWRVTVVEVVDGDTMDVRLPNGTVWTVRLLGVDTPEVHVETDPAEWEGIPENEAGRTWLSDWGDKATDFARSAIAGEEVTIRTDPEADRRGFYGRLLVYLYHDGGQFLNYELLTDGYARFYDSTFSKADRFESAEQTAQADDVGVWGYTPPTTTTTTTTTTTDGGKATLAVVEIHEDASGNDHENENNEYIVFDNTGSETLDLSGWTVSDAAGHTYTFPDWFTLEPGERVTLHTGSGTDTDEDLYWGSDSAIWNNGGDTLTVRDDSGNIVLQRSYE